MKIYIGYIEYHFLKQRVMLKLHVLINRKSDLLKANKTKK